MKVLYDHQIFTLQDFGGISRIYTELLKPGKYDFNFTSKLSLKLSNNHYLSELENIKYSNFFPKKYIPRKTQLMNLVNEANTKKIFQKGNFDIFHPTYYDPYFLPYLKNKPFVVTFLDMIHERFSDIYPDLALDKKIFNNKKQLLENATTVISISESTKRDIQQFFDIDEKKIKVIYLATSIQRNFSDPLIKGDYLLFVGRRERYKNFNLLIKAIQPTLKTNSELKLICAGGGKFEQSEIDLIKELNLENQVIQYAFNNDTVLSNLYSNALAFIFPSLYEGFGIPVLESFACGCPTLLSNSSSLPEVGGDAAIYFDANDEHSINNAVSKVINDTNLRTQLKELGLKRNQSFSWHQHNQETIKLYNSLVAK